MGIESQLLRMLEPAVRPDGINGPSRKAVVPIEARGFDELLAEAGQVAQQAASGVAPGQDQPGNAMHALGDVLRIENESLRRLIGDVASDARTPPGE